mgnify:CR=1 FL=1
MEPLTEEEVRKQLAKLKKKEGSREKNITDDAWLKTPDSYPQNDINYQLAVNG